MLVLVLVSLGAVTWAGWCSCNWRCGFGFDGASAPTVLLLALEMFLSGVFSLWEIELGADFGGPPWELMVSNSSALEELL